MSSSHGLEQGLAMIYYLLASINCIRRSLHYFNHLDIKAPSYGDRGPD